MNRIGLDKRKLLSVFEESQHLYMPPSRPHGLLYSRFKEWVEKHQTDRLYELAKEIYERSRYVSHSEFFSKYDLIAEELLHRIESQSDRKVFMYLGMSRIKKSNFWILLYLLSRMSRVIDYVITESDLAHITEDSIVIVPDDAIYSGKQMTSQLSRLFSGVRNPEQVHVIIASSFISNKGRYYIRSRVPHTIIFPEHSESFDSIALPEDVYVYNTPGVDVHTLYFDHKLPDLVSIFQTIYALGVGLSDEEFLFPFEPMSLIDNCDAVESIHQYMNDGSDDSVYIFLDEVLGEQGSDLNDYIPTCPVPPYKTLEYMFNGRVLGSVEELR